MRKLSLLLLLISIGTLQALSFSGWNNIRFTGRSADNTVIMRTEINEADLTHNSLIYNNGNGVVEAGLGLIDSNTNTYQTAFAAPNVSFNYGLKKSSGAQPATIVPIPHNSTSLPSLNLMTKVSEDISGDQSAANCDVVADYVAFSDSKVFTAIQNRGGGFPTSGGLFGPYYSYMSIIGNPNTDPNDPNAIVWALHYVSVPVLFSTGLYKITGTGISDITRIAGIQTTIDSGNNALIMGADLSNMYNDPDFQAWFDPANPVIGLITLVNRIALPSTVTQMDNSLGGYLIPTPLSMNTDNINQMDAHTDGLFVTATDVYFQSTYTGPADMFPISVHFITNNNDIYPMTSTAVDFSQPVVYRTANLLGTIPDCDNLIGYTYLEPALQIYVPYSQYIFTYPLSATIGTGTTADRYPLDDYYIYSRSQMLYLSSEIGAGSHINIKKISWFRNDTGADPDAIGTLEVWMKETTATTISGTDWEEPGTLVATLTNVDLGSGNDWFTIDTTDFLLPNGQNLLVSVRTQNAPYTSPHSYWRYTTATNMMRAGQSDDTNPPSMSVSSSRPNIKLSYLYATVVPPPNPALLVSPAADGANILLDATLNWTSGGGAPTSYDVYFGTTNPPTFIRNQAETTFNPAAVVGAMTYGMTYYWKIIPYNENGPATATCPVWSFTVMNDPTIIPNAIPYVQNFDGNWSGTPAAPLGWKVINANGDDYTWRKDNDDIQPTHSGLYSAYGSGNSDDWLITPPINQNSAVAKISWWDKVEHASYPNNYDVYVSTTGTAIADFSHYLGTYSCTNIAWTQHELFLNGFANETIYVAFHQTHSQELYFGFGIDDVEIVKIFTNDMAATDISSSSPIAFVGQPLNFEVTVFNSGISNQSNFNVVLYKVGHPIPVGSKNYTNTIVSGASEVITMTWTPSTTGTVNLYAKIVLASDQNTANNLTGTTPVNVYSANAFTPVIGDTQTTSATMNIPINIYYKNGVSETIYLDNEMQMTSGTIKGIAYFNNFVEDLNKGVKVWMKNTTEANVETTWLDSAGYTLVFDGDVHFPLGAGLVYVPLNTPFEYTGGNLAMRVYRVWEDIYWSSSNQFYYTASPEYPNRSRYFYADGDGPLDPIALTPYGSSTPLIGNLTNNIPLTMFIADPATPIASLATPEVVLRVTNGTVRLDWNPVPGAYAYRIYTTDDTNNWSDNPVESVRVNYYETSENIAKEFFKVVAVTNYRNETLGIVSNPSTRSGVDITAKETAVQKQPK